MTLDELEVTRLQPIVLGGMVESRECALHGDQLAARAITVLLQPVRVDEPRPIGVGFRDHGIEQGAFVGADRRACRAREQAADQRSPGHEKGSQRCAS